MRWHPLDLPLLRIAAIALGIAVAALSCPGCSCRGCGPSFVWTAPLRGRPTDAELRSLTVRLCRNGVCADTPLSGLDDGGNSVELEGGGLLFIRRLSAGRIELEVTYWDPNVADGDRWAIEVTDASGAIVVGLSERAVDYGEFENNTPFDHCRFTRFEGNLFDAPPIDGGP